MKETREKLVIAHMGASHYEERNTIAAFKLAVYQKADMVEMDVRKTKDNRLIINHDKKILGKRIDKTDYDELKKSKNDLCTLEEALMSLKNKVRVDIHLKEKGYEKSAINFILKHLKKEDFFICTNYFSSVKKIKEKFKDIKVGIVFEIEPKNMIYFPFGYFPKKKLQRLNIDYIIPRWNFVNKRFIKKAEKLNIPVYIWTVNSEKVIKKFLDIRIVKGFITDRPDYVIERMKKLD